MMISVLDSWFWQELPSPAYPGVGKSLGAFTVWGEKVSWETFSTQ